TVELKSDLRNADFYLVQTDVTLPEIVVLPGENPALEIIRKAIKRKRERNEKIFSYKFEAYTKAVIRTPNEIEAGSNTIDVSIGDEDTLIIAGIIENESKGYFQKPDNYKEIISARKQTVNFPPSINILTGGRIMQNFYNDEISFLGLYLPGPLADNSLDYYYFYIEETVAIDDKTVYKIHITPDDESDPGFTGSIFILDKTYDLIKVNLNLNEAANPGGIFDTVNVFQQFSSYDEALYMPVDYRLFAIANYLNIFRFGFELNTILYDYNINQDIDESIFNKAIITVQPQADEKDSLYWTSTQTIPATEEETKAYDRIDSIKNIPRTFWDDFSILSTRMRLADNFEITTPLGIYHFNSVEGHAIDYGFFLNNAFERRFNSSLKFSYGFADEKFKTDFNGSYLFGDYRTYELEFNAFRGINILFSESDAGQYSELVESISALFFKNSINDYFYSKGFDIKFTGDVFPVLSLSIGYINRTDNNAYNNTDFSFFKKDKKYSVNSPVYETKINAIAAGFGLDFRNFIEDGFFRRRVFSSDSYITFGGNVTFSNSDLLRSGVNFTKYDLNSYARIRTFRNSVLSLKTNFVYSDGKVPYQMLYILAGNIDYISRSFTFRTIGYNEAAGDRIAAASLEHDFGNELFRWLEIPGLKDWDILLNTFFNAAYTDISDESRSILVVKQEVFRNPFYEIGFGIGHQLIPLQLEFAWKLNHRDGSNFRIGINSFIN
ncbi:MAG: DUF5686 family protein, partial [Ignavibacteria bacterium]|nr:DUF5686 family protein [Ignavibacteria bacterium]